MAPNEHAKLQENEQPESMSMAQVVVLLAMNTLDRTEHKAQNVHPKLLSEITALKQGDSAATFDH